MSTRVVCFSVLLALITIEGHAATYYVRNGGNDSADGKSHETAWATVKKVNSFSFAPGDSVLFHEGHVWRQQALVVDWGGTSSAKAVVGSYYVLNGKPVRGFKTARPTFDGENQFPTQYDSLITVRAPHVRLENISMIKSGGRGLSTYDAHFFHATGLHVNDTYDCGIVLIESDDGLVEHNHVVETNTEKLDGKNWCAAIATVRSDRAIIRRNLVERGYGEGINTNYGSTDTVIEDNRVYAIRSAGIYVDSAPNTIVRRNIVLGTSDKTYWRYSSTVGPGIAINTEAYSHDEGGGKLPPTVQSTNVRIYNNLVASTGHGVAVWGGLKQNSFDGTLIYNNTFVDNSVQFLTLGQPMPNSIFANNILLSITEGTKDVSGTSSGLKTRNNYYSKGDPGGIYTHSGNKYTGLQLRKMSGWRSINGVSAVSAADFAPAETSATNGAGDDAHLAAASSKDAFHLDYNSNEHNRPIDMGALRFGDSGGKRPKGPRLVGAEAR